MLFHTFNFRGEVRTALEFDQSAFGGDLTIVTYRNMGSAQDPSEADYVIWGQLAAKSGFIMPRSLLTSRLVQNRRCPD